MNILVTGAGGFLGQSVVATLLSSDHRVRAVVRSTPAPSKWPGTIEICRCDLAKDDLTSVLAGVNAVIHLAGHSSALDGLDAAVLGTARLCEAISASQVKRVCHVSSLAVYDWSGVDNVLDEQCPLAEIATAPTDYAKSKLRQEELVRRLDGSRLIVTIVRPGFIWGHTRLWVDGVGRRLPRAYLLVAPEASVPLTHVDNCADAVVSAALEGEGTFNIVDGPLISRRQYLQAYVAGSGASGIVIPISYQTGLSLVTSLRKVFRGMLNIKRLPSMLDPIRFEGQFKPIVVSADRIRRELGWTPPLGFASAANRSFVSRV
ncbi:NAD-dependent epimerase/dehydratase family protein [Bradyrhizobium sp. AZCC 2230]|uniref:NAD-dependent epimerase/dehydratase family protein n=1 Tax=Bradyrhizobium sp. AZCC 2230 TaxID=3117021 RepID=UPI002FF2F53F